MHGGKQLMQTVTSQDGLFRCTSQLSTWQMRGMFSLRGSSAALRTP